MPASLYTPEMVEKVCDLIIGEQSLSDIERMKGMPTKSCILKWVKAYPEFKDRYLEAMQLRMISLADGAMDIATNRSHTVPERSLMLDALKWQTGKFHSAMFGNKVSNEVTGKDGAPLAAAVVYLPDNGRD